jgi:hypothetical protein
MKSKLPIIALLCAMLLATGACGKKPSFVDPPENGAKNGDGTAQQGTFPRPYPKPWL